jgi:hypothetical protein
MNYESGNRNGAKDVIVVGRNSVLVAENKSVMVMIG